MLEPESPQGDDTRIGSIIAGYTIVAPLGSGSMSTVYRARRQDIGREVALKLLRSDLSGESRAKARFATEATSTGRLTSMNTVTVFDFGEVDATAEQYIAMELLEGESLGDRLKWHGRFPYRVAIDVAVQALRSLAEAHAKGIIHCDLKPDNIFFASRVRESTRDLASLSLIDEPSEIVKVLDFGIARLSGEIDVDAQRGVVFGTPRYMSPEQALGWPLDARSDLYSLGTLLYEMLVGHAPFTSYDPAQVMQEQVQKLPIQTRLMCPEANIPLALDRIVMRLLAKDPGLRPQTAADLVTELMSVLELVGD